MRSRLLSEVAHKQRIRVLTFLYRDGDLTVGQLAELMRMSYMGVKKHCQDLQKQGYLETARKPKPMGRPELLYRLSAKAQRLFVKENHSVALGLLAASAKLFGNTAPSKLLFLHFEELQAGYLNRLRGESTTERAAALARLREVDGWVSRYLEEPSPRLCERNSPYADLMEAYPLIERLEADMIGRLVGCQVRREEGPAQGEVSFVLKTTG